MPKSKFILFFEETIDRFCQFLFGLNRRAIALKLLRLRSEEVGSFTERSRKSDLG